MIGLVYETVSRNTGLRHSTLSAQMPSESSSVVCNETNGIGLVTTCLLRNQKKDPLKQIVFLIFKKLLYITLGYAR